METKPKIVPRIFAGLIVLLMAVALFLSWRSPFSRAVQEDRPLFGLLVGTDYVDNARHSDTIVLVHYDPATRSLDLLSIPRDTRVELPHLKIKKITEVYAYAFRNSKKSHEAACRELIKTVQWLLFSRSTTSLDDLPPSVPQIPFYAQVDYTGFKKVIDLLGGVEVTVDEPMHYDDNWGNLHIHFDPGKYVLNGQKALEYVRFRGQSGDFGRVLRQQEFLMNIFKRFKNPVNILKLPKIVWISLTSIRTNLGWYDRLLVLNELKDLAREHIRLMQLPGRSSKEGYWMPNYEDITATADLIFSGKPSMEIQASTTAISSADSGSIASKPTVEVWNASSRKGLALDVVRQLRSAGFDVVKWGNYSSRQQRTMVRDHKGDKQQARAIAAALTSSRVEVFTRVESNPLVDVEVILGEDYGTEK